MSACAPQMLHLRSHCPPAESRPAPLSTRAQGPVPRNATTRSSLRSIRRGGMRRGAMPLSPPPGEEGNERRPNPTSWSLVLAHISRRKGGRARADVENHWRIPAITEMRSSRDRLPRRSCALDQAALLSNSADGLRKGSSCRGGAPRRTSRATALTQANSHWRVARDPAEARSRQGLPRGNFLDGAHEDIGDDRHAHETPQQAHEVEGLQAPGRLERASDRDEASRGSRRTKSPHTSTIT